MLIAWRWLVLGGLGGYYDRTPPLSNLDVALNDLLQSLLFPFYAVLGRTPRAWLTEIGLAAVISGAAALVGGRRTRTVIVYGWVWFVVCALFQLLTKSLAAWHTYLTAAGFAFLAGGVLDTASDVWRSPAKAWPSKALVAASVAGVLWFEVALLQSSVILRPFDEWRVAGDVARTYLLSLRPCLESAPPGVPIVIGNAPEQLEVTTPERRLIHAGILGPYSVAPAVQLVMPEFSSRDLTARNLIQLDGLPTSMSTRCSMQDGAWTITTDYTM